jgi:hypothetical protein
MRIIFNTFHIFLFEHGFKLEYFFIEYAILVYNIFANLILIIASVTTSVATLEQTKSLIKYFLLKL